MFGYKKRNSLFSIKKALKIISYFSIMFQFFKE